jgi:hypothetical protein
VGWVNRTCARQGDQQAKARPRQLGTMEHPITWWSGVAYTKMTPMFRDGPSQQTSADVAQVSFRGRSRPDLSIASITACDPRRTSPHSSYGMQKQLQ